MPDPAPPPLTVDELATQAGVTREVMLQRIATVLARERNALYERRDNQKIAIEELREALRECADELAAELDARHRFRSTNSYVMGQWERDMDVVRRARELLLRIPSENGA